MKDKNKTESSEIIFSEKTATPFYFSFDEDAAQHTMILSGAEQAWVKAPQFWIFWRNVQEIFIKNQRQVNI